MSFPGDPWPHAPSVPEDDALIALFGPDWARNNSRTYDYRAVLDAYRLGLRHGRTAERGEDR